jgi:hypothetical protein
MLITGQVYDNETGTGIPYASVTITDTDGKTFLGGTAADGYGLFMLDNPILDDSKYLYVTSSGYMPVLVDDDVYTQSGMIGLDQAGNLPTVYVTPDSNKNDWFIYILFGGGLVLLLATARKEKKVSGLTIPKLADNQWLDIAIKIGIPIAIYFLVLKPILVALNLLPDKREQQQNQSDDQAQNQQQQLGVYNSTDNHSYTQSVIDGVAVALRNDTLHAYGYNWGDLPYQLTWLVGMTSADAKYFLGTFVKKNGLTFYRWWQEKFSDALIVAVFNWNVVVFDPAWYESGTAHDWSAYYNKVGITKSNADAMEWWQVVQKFVDYIYTVAGVTKQ